MQRREGPERPFRRSYGGGGRGGFEGGFRRAYGGPAGPTIDYRALVEFVAKSIADKPDEVQVHAIEKGHGTVAIKIRMAEADMGRLIGKSGRNIDALRTLVRVASLRERKRVFVDLATGR